MLADDDGAGCLGLFDGVGPCKRGHVGERQRILDGQVLQHPMRARGQRRDELLDLSGEPAVFVAGRLDLDAGQQVVAPERRNLVGHRPVRRDGDDHRHRAADRQLVDERRGQPVEQMRVVDDQHAPVAQRLAGGPQHRRRLAGLGYLDQVTEGGERKRRRRRRHPVDPGQPHASRSAATRASVVLPTPAGPISTAPVRVRSPVSSSSSAGSCGAVTHSTGTAGVYG